MGCYEYGNLLSVDEAWFIGAEAEQASVETEREKGCRATQRDHAAILKYFQRVEDKAAFTRELRERPLNINYSTFVSDQIGQNREPRLSFVLQLYIGLELINEGDNNFVQNNITIQTSRTDGFNQKIEISPDNDNDDRFVKLFVEIYGERYAINEKETIIFNASLEGEVRISNALFNIFANGRQIWQLSVPVVYDFDGV